MDKETYYAELYEKEEKNKELIDVLTLTVVNLIGEVKDRNGVIGEKLSKRIIDDLTDVAYVLSEILINAD